MSAASFVESCVTFQSNVTCKPVAAVADAAANATLLFLLPQDRACLVKPTAGGLWSDALDVAAGRAGEGSPYWTDLASGRRAALGVLPTHKVSRNNCAVRPDAITSIVSAVAAAKDTAAIAVVSCLPATEGFEAAIASAIAKGTKRSFSAKCGKAEKSYLEPCVPVVVYIAKTEADVPKLNALCRSVQLAMRLVDAPTNLLDTVTFAEIAKKYAAALGFEFSEIRGEELREKGYGGVYGVGKAAEYPPALVTLTYKPKLGEGIQPKDKIAFVGKGIVYDTGGLSIKTPTTNMCGMKMDMGGAGAMFAAFVALVETKTAHPIDCVLCLADNAVGPKAQRNDDIVIMKSGKTIEINNTDAEGRLVLGDGVFHAACLSGSVPAVVVDMATLTGAQGIATGARHSGLFTNSLEWERKVVDNGIVCGDLVFPLLFAPEFHVPEFSSKVADMRNSVRNRSNAQSSCAAAFIAENLPSEFKGVHVHLDIAAPAHQAEGATGYGVALLMQLFSA